MKLWKNKLVPALFALAGALFLVAAVKPALTGGALNSALLGMGVVFLVLGIVLSRRRRDGARP